ncbi:MAG: hypothetical protein HYU63_01995 [Armatimonadetes bacterium]|nr:hypothetical protein [Armatimonadota bacterium]
MLKKYNFLAVLIILIGFFLNIDLIKAQIPTNIVNKAAAPVTPSTSNTNNPPTNSNKLDFKSTPNLKYTSGVGKSDPFMSAFPKKSVSSKMPGAPSGVQGSAGQPSVTGIAFINGSVWAVFDFGTYSKAFKKGDKDKETGYFIKSIKSKVVIISNGKNEIKLNLIEDTAYTKSAENKIPVLGVPPQINAPNPTQSGPPQTVPQVPPTQGQMQEPSNPPTPPSAPQVPNAPPAPPETQEQKY